MYPRAQAEKVNKDTDLIPLLQKTGVKAIGRLNIKLHGVETLNEAYSLVKTLRILLLGVISSVLLVTSWPANFELARLSCAPKTTIGVDGGRSGYS